MTWGHAVSPDLVHWCQLEHALHPDALGTIFSGSALVDWDNHAGFGDARTHTEQPAMLAYYTSAGGYANPPRPFTQSLAYTTNRGRTWTKCPNNPVLDHIAGDNRDPRVFFHTPSGQFDLAFDLDPGSARRVTLWIRGVPMVFEGDVLRFRDRHVQMPSAAPSVRLLIDLTSVEVFLDGGIASASFCFLPDAYIDALSVRAKGSGAALRNMRLHALKGIW